MGLFDKVESARPKVDASYIRAGNYLARIDRVKQGESRKKDPFVAIEMTVLKCLEREGGVEPHKPGESVSQLYMHKSDYFDSEVKAFVMAVTGCSEGEVTPAACEQVCDPKVQPLANVVVEFHAKTRMTKLGKNITVVAFKRAIPYSVLKAKDKPNGGLLDDAEIARFIPPAEMEKRIREEAELESLAGTK